MVPWYPKPPLGVLGLEEPIGHGLDAVRRDLETGLRCLPGAEHAVLGHRGVARFLLRVAPAAVRLLFDLEVLQQHVDLAAVGAGVERDQEDDRQAGAIDVQIGLRRVVALDGALDGGDRLDDPRVLGVGVALQEHQADQARAPTRPSLAAGDSRNLTAFSTAALTAGLSGVKANALWPPPDHGYMVPATRRNTPTPAAALPRNLRLAFIVASFRSHRPNRSNLPAAAARATAGLGPRPEPRMAAIKKPP